MQGHVTRYWPDKGFGFVENDDTGESFFFHRSDLLPDVPPPQKNQPVSFDVVPNRRRGPNEMKAVRLRPLSGQEVLGGAS
jgi:cold shock CspA family protein